MLKLLVNDPNIWPAFVEEVEKRIKEHHKNIEQYRDPDLIFEEKGALRALRSLLQLRDKVNVRE